jgi:hypothetical protein
LNCSTSNDGPVLNVSALGLVEPISKALHAYELQHKCTVPQAVVMDAFIASEEARDCDFWASLDGDTVLGGPATDGGGSGGATTPDRDLGMLAHATNGVFCAPVLHNTLMRAFDDLGLPMLLHELLRPEAVRSAVAEDILGVPRLAAVIGDDGENAVHIQQGNKHQRSEGITTDDDSLATAGSSRLISYTYRDVCCALLARGCVPVGITRRVYAPSAEVRRRARVSPTARAAVGAATAAEGRLFTITNPHPRDVLWAGDMVLYLGK